MNGAGAGHGCLLRCSTSAGNNETRSIGHDWLRAPDRTVFLLVLPLLPLVSSRHSVTCVTIFLSTVSIAAYCFLRSSLLSLSLSLSLPIPRRGGSRWFLGCFCRLSTDCFFPIFFFFFQVTGHLQFRRTAGRLNFSGGVLVRRCEALVITL